VGSFNRRNLSYAVVRKQASYAQLLGLIQRFQGESGIVYCGSRAATESLARKLSEDGVNARPYHAGLLPAERSQNQEAFIRDEVPVICATIAFGMGIDKPNVRFVVHYDLPGSIENYYQETGRAGRDGLPSECTLLYSAGDQMKRERFIDEKADAKEREIARAQLQEMVQYGESLECRRRLLLHYFGEEFADENCAGCDNCLAPEPTLDAGASARKLLACVEAIRNKSGFGTGLTHVIDVLAGGNTERVRKWGHDDLPAYASGREHNKADWTSIGHELLRRGYLLKNAERFNIIELTREGREALAGTAPLELRMREPAAPFAAKTRDTGGYDPELFERLRAVRRRLAAERNQPPFVIFSDVALRQMAREYPQDRAGFLRVSGVGARKLEEFSELFLGEIAAHLASHPRQTFDDPQPALALGRASLGDSHRETLRRFRAGETVAEIARSRDLALSTVMGHLGTAAEAGEEIDLGQFLTPEQQQEIAAAVERLGPQNLTALRETLGERYDYGVLRLYRAQALRPPVPTPA
jgi:ATP-dependent DNA helicase RecQ